MYGKLSEKLTCTYQGLGNFSFSENFAYALNVLAHQFLEFRLDLTQILVVISLLRAM